MLLAKGCTEFKCTLTSRTYLRLLKDVVGHLCLLFELSQCYKHVVDMLSTCYECDK